MEERSKRKLFWKIAIPLIFVATLVFANGAFIFDSSETGLLFNPRLEFTLIIATLTSLLVVVAFREMRKSSWKKPNVFTPVFLAAMMAYSVFILLMATFRLQAALALTPGSDSLIRYIINRF